MLNLPFSMTMFLILKTIEWILRRLGLLSHLQTLLKPFRSFVRFVSCVFAENMTYLSFHSFLHMYRFVPFSHGDNSFPSCVLCLFNLFIILMTAICLGFIAWVFARRSFEVEYCKINCKSYLFLSFAVAGKFASGFFHAFVDDP